MIEALVSENLVDDFVEPYVGSNEGSVVSSTLPVNTDLHLVGDSMTYGNGGQLWFYGWWLLAACRGVFNLPQTVGLGSSNPSGGNMGVSGNTTAQMAARKTTIAAAVGDGVLILGGGQNDAVDVTAQDIIDNFEEIISECNSNATILIQPVAPTVTVTGNPILTMRKNTVDAHFASRAGITFMTNTFDGIDYSDSDYSSDGVHETSFGGKTKGENIAVYVNALFNETKTGYDTLSERLPVPDWANWDNSQDSASQYFFSDGYSSPTAFDFTGDNEFIALTRTRATGSQTNRRVVTCNSWDDSTLTITQESALELSASSTGTMPYVAKMSDSRILMSCMASGAGFIALIGKDGTTLTEEAIDTTLSFYSGTENAKGSIYRLTDTKAVFVYLDGSDFKAVIVDITGDTITYGTPLDTGDNESDYCGCAVLSETQIVLGAGSRLTYCTISGDTITEVSSLTHGAGTGDISLVARNATQLMGVFEGNAGGMYMALFELDGTTLSEVDGVVIDGTFALFTGSQDTNLAKLDDNNFMFAGYLNTTTDTTITNIVVKINSDDTLTELVQDKTSRGDHIQVKGVPNSNGTMALLVTQDGSTSPIDQTNYRFLKSASPENLIPSNMRDYSTGWSFSNSTGATVVQSNGTLGGASSKIFTISGTITGENTFRYRRQLSGGGFSVLQGQEYVGMSRVSITNAAQDGAPVGLAGFSLQVFYANILWGTLTFDSGTRDISSAIKDASFINKIIKTASENITVDNAALTFDYSLRFDNAVPNPDVRVEFSEPVLYKHS